MPEHEGRAKLDLDKNIYGKLLHFLESDPLWSPYDPQFIAPR